VEPVGVLEATRAGEVVETIEAAEAATGRGHWVAGFVAYEAAPGLDPALVVRSRDADDPFAALPLAWFAMFERAEETTLPLPREEEGISETPEGTWVPTTGRERYESSVDRIRELIAAGETYQVNHTMRLRSHVEGDPRGLYRDLSYAQRGAFSAYLDLGRYRVLSASPELFFELRDGAIVTKPMKGTAPRGRWPDEDRAVAESLLASAKDRAENAMIVDLLRNDLGRVSRAGSVTWADVFQAERYETVWQLTTTVSAEPARRCRCRSRCRTPSAGSYRIVSRSSKPGRRAVRTRVFATASAYSAPASESHVMPPPTPYSAVRETVSRVTVRIATLNRAFGKPDPCGAR
jgi:para-aminobenzoate synthetase/4-amino-4-deoxychorismate lyase